LAEKDDDDDDNSLLALSHIKKALAKNAPVSQLKKSSLAEKTNRRFLSEKFQTMAQAKSSSEAKNADMADQFDDDDQDEDDEKDQDST